MKDNYLSTWVERYKKQFPHKTEPYCVDDDSMEADDIEVFQKNLFEDVDFQLPVGVL